MTKRPYGQGLLNVFPALLFAVLAACVLSVLLSGTKIYSEITQQNQQAYVSRTVRQYICTKVQQAENPSSVYVEEFGDEIALVIERKLDDRIFVERIYHHENYLRELFTFADSELTPQDGEKLMELSLFAPSLEHGLLTVQIRTNGGNTQTIYLDVKEVVYGAQ